MNDFLDYWQLLLIPVFFGLGWAAARIDIRQVIRESRALPRSYFRGLNFLLNEQPDRAIEAFVDAVKVDPQTVELHFALGSLFRRRGDFFGQQEREHVIQFWGGKGAIRQHPRFEPGLKGLIGVHVDLDQGGRLGSGNGPLTVSRPTRQCGRRRPHRQRPGVGSPGNRPLKLAWPPPPSKKSSHVSAESTDSRCWPGR